jgi:hypothetical protein
LAAEYFLSMFFGKGGKGGRAALAKSSQMKWTAGWPEEDDDGWLNKGGLLNDDRVQQALEGLPMRRR